MADVIAYAELRDGALRPVARETVSAARALADDLGGDVVALALGGPGSAAAARELAAYGADRILTAENEAFANYDPDAAVRAIESISRGESAAAIVFPASAQGKDLSARVAGRLDRSLASEVTELGVEDGSVVLHEARVSTATVTMSALHVASSHALRFRTVMRKLNFALFSILPTFIGCSQKVIVLPVPRRTALFGHFRHT